MRVSTSSIINNRSSFSLLSGCFVIKEGNKMLALKIIGLFFLGCTIAVTIIVLVSVLSQK